ncbi:MAG TPA: hypothetical protein VIR81_14400 [Myxococcales bacterium]
MAGKPSTLNPEPEPEPVPRTREGKIAKADPRSERAQHLLGLFAYHRDAPLVARALGVSVSDLHAELDALAIRTRAYRLTRGTDADLPAAVPVKGASGPPVRRRARAAPPSPAPPEPAPKPAADPEQALLKSVLAEVGPRRAALADRLGASGGALLARFRAAGLEREFSLRERDLIRALWAKHRASEAKVAADLGETPEGLRDIVVMRGLARELDAVRDRLRHEVRRKKWPADRIDQVLRHADELRDLGLYDELLREVSARAGVVWASLRGKSDALELFAKKLRLGREDAIGLQKLLDLR